VKFKDRGALDFQQAGGQDTAWVQVYYALRCGQDDLALRAAAKATDAAAAVRPLGSGGGLAALLEAWLQDASGCVLVLCVWGGGSSVCFRVCNGWGVVCCGSQSLPINVTPPLPTPQPPSFRAQHGAAMLRECERLVQSAPTKQSALRVDYMLLVYALLAGDARAVDAATRRSPGLAPTIEDFMWLKLTTIRACGATGAWTGGWGRRGGFGFF